MAGVSMSVQLHIPKIFKLIFLMGLVNFVTGCDLAEPKDVDSSSSNSTNSVPIDGDNSVAINALETEYDVAQTIREAVGPGDPMIGSARFIRSVENVDGLVLAEISDESVSKYESYVPFRAVLDPGVYRFSGVFQNGSAADNTVLFRVRSKRDDVDTILDVQLDTTGQVIKQSDGLIHVSNSMLSNDLTQISMVFDVIGGEENVIFYAFPAIGSGKKFDKVATGNAIVGNFSLEKIRGQN